MRTRTDVLMSMTDDDLLKTFFSNGGSICAEEFSVPMPSSFETSEAYCAYQILSERSSGRKILFNLQKKFKQGLVDCSGKPILEQNVI